MLAHPKGCVDDLRFIRPWAVDCGSAGEHPDADALATAILAIPATSGSTDLGDLQSAGAVPPGMFADQYHGRVVEMLGYNPLFQAGAVNRDDCRLLPEPGSDDPVIEIRRDLSALFVLLDVNGELIVIRASVAGYDGPSGAEAQSRGYGQGGSAELRHLLGARLRHPVRRRSRIAGRFLAAVSSIPSIGDELGLRTGASRPAAPPRSSTQRLSLAQVLQGANDASSTPASRRAHRGGSARRQRLRRDHHPVLTGSIGNYANAWDRRDVRTGRALVDHGASRDHRRHRGRSARGRGRRARLDPFVGLPAEP